MPPTTSERGDQQSDEEDVAENLGDEFEPAGELEVEEDESSDEEPEAPLQKRARREEPRWKHSTAFDKVLPHADCIQPLDALESLANGS